MTFEILKYLRRGITSHPGNKDELHLLDTAIRIIEGLLSRIDHFKQANLVLESRLFSLLGFPRRMIENVTEARRQKVTGTALDAPSRLYCPICNQEVLRNAASTRFLAYPQPGKPSEYFHPECVEPFFE